MVVGDGRIGWGGELFSSLNAPSGELQGSVSNGLPRAWRWKAQEISSKGPLSSCKWNSAIGARGQLSRSWSSCKWRSGMGVTGRLLGSWWSCRWRLGIGVRDQLSGSWSNGFSSLTLTAGCLLMSSAPVVSFDMSTGAFGTLNCKGSANVWSIIRTCQFW